MNTFQTDFYTDLTWMNKISFKLELFTRKSHSSHVYACRCPICGDSKKKKRLTRCYFYEKDHGLFVQCKNCGYSRTFWNFMVDVFPNDFQEYKRDQLKQSIELLKPNTSQSLQSKTIDEFRNDRKESLKVIKTEEFLTDCVSLDKLDPTHPCIQYLESRHIPKEIAYSRLLYTDHFKRIARELSCEELPDTFPDDGRLVIPFFSEDGSSIEMMQGRTLNPKCSMRYVTIKTNSNIDKIYGKDSIDRTKTVYCVEGPLDSLFIPNCLATCDSSLLRANADVYIYDNEPRNEEIVKLMSKTIDLGKSLVIWPLSPDSKLDINDMITLGLSQSDIMTIIQNNTFNGLKARLKFSEWRKV